MPHYFTNNENLKHQYQHILYQIENQTFRFLTDAGVFSKNEVDQGTDILLRTLQKQDLSGHCLDLGCGYGVIGIVVKSIFSINIVGVDINPRAISLAKQNAQSYNQSNTYIVSDGIAQIDDAFHHIFLNPPIRTGKQNVYRLYQECLMHLKQNGILWIVIRKKQGAESTVSFLEDKMSVSIVHKEKGYWILKCLKK